MDAAKRKTNDSCLVCPGLGTRIPDNTHPLLPPQNVRTIKPFSQVEGGCSARVHPELSISTQMKAEECRKNRDWHGKYKSLGAIL